MDQRAQVAWKMALQIHEQLRNSNSSLGNLQLPESSWHQVEKLLRQTRAAEHNGWLLAGDRCRQQFVPVIQEMKRDLSLLESHITTTNRYRHERISAIDLWKDIVALDAEFDGVILDLQNRALSVTTAPIELEGVYLGTFQIELSWNNSGCGHQWRYHIIAGDPHPAASNEDVTHPHVQSESLCEGDGTESINAALQTGRLLDFFTLVNCVLRNYNSASAYVELEDWEGTTCSECGALMNSEEYYTCEGCSTRFCDDCRTVCLDCEENFCLSCMGLCHGCKEYHCRYCLRNCRDCHEKVCSGCRNNKERCDKCYAREPDEKKETDERPNNASDAEVAVHPHRVG